MGDSFLEGASRQGRSSTKKCRKRRKRGVCHQPFPLTCQRHGETIWVPCGRWKECPGCCDLKSWELKARFLAGMQNVPKGFHPMFVTLTFPRDSAPDEDQAHAALRSLVGRLRYRKYLGAYGWVLQRQSNGTLHYHGIFHLPWFEDDLVEWRRLVEASGFGTQQNIKKAEPRHAGYVASYLSTRLAQLNPVRRAFTFSQKFPRSEFELARERDREINGLLRLHDIYAGCDWLPSSVVDSWLH